MPETTPLVKEPVYRGRPRGALTKRGTSRPPGTHIRTTRSTSGARRSLSLELDANLPPLPNPLLSPLLPGPVDPVDPVDMANNPAAAAGNPAQKDAKLPNIIEDDIPSWLTLCDLHLNSPQFSFQDR